MNTPFFFAARAKGVGAMLHRLVTIGQHYGFTEKKMEQTLRKFIDLVKPYEVYPTFPITGQVLARKPAVARWMDQAGVELAVHGWTHVALASMSPSAQIASIERAQSAFALAQIPAIGFRSPYLSRHKELPAILQNAGFRYVSNQTIFWPVVEANDYTPAHWAVYQRALAFYAPWSPVERVSTPYLLGTLVEVPVSLPDDEMLVDRLGITDPKVIEAAWQVILAQTYQQEGLFTLQLHPERIHQCGEALTAVLCTAQNLTPSVWLARLSEIADWWQARLATQVTIRSDETDLWAFHSMGPTGLVWLLRGVQTNAMAHPWADGYDMVVEPELSVRSPVRPVVGVPPDAPVALLSFLQQQGYLVEPTDTPNRYSIYLDQPDFDPSQEQQILAQIEQSGRPLVRLGRWPHGARSAMAITGDIDALTMWDYLWRLFGR